MIGKVRSIILCLYIINFSTWKCSNLYLFVSLKFINEMKFLPHNAKYTVYSLFCFTNKFYVSINSYIGYPELKTIDQSNIILNTIPIFNKKLHYHCVFCFLKKKKKYCESLILIYLKYKILFVIQIEILKLKIKIVFQHLINILKKNIYHSKIYLSLH